MKFEGKKMNSIQMCQKLQETTRLIIVHDRTEIISTGSGVIINSKGDVLTAAHVVTTRLPVRPEDVEDPEIRILIGNVNYKPMYCGITISTQYLRKPISIDLAILTPSLPQSNMPFLPINEGEPPIGSKVLMAGFSDEIELPFSFDRIIDYQHPLLKEIPSALQSSGPILKNIFGIMRRQLLIKSGMIGKTFGFNFSDSKNNSYSGNLLYIDNVMHSGASGGPIVNDKPEIIGIITERAITSVPYEETPKLKVPSGSTVAITPKAFSQIIKSL